MLLFLHDYAKCFTIDELKKYIIHYKLPQALLHYHFELWHGPVGCQIAEIEFGIKDEISCMLFTIIQPEESI